MGLFRPDPHSLSGAYALDALETEAERDRFTRHLSRCPSCAGEVRGFREVATAMAFATADPYVRAGLVTEWSVRPWTTVVGDSAATPVRS